MSAPGDITATQGDHPATTDYNRVAARTQLAMLDRSGLVARQALYFLAVLLVGSVLWASLAESDICAEALGQLVPRTRLQIIRPAVDGTIEKYLVNDGQAVKKGDTLVLLNRVRAEADLNKQRQDLAILQTQRREHTKAKDALEQIIADPHRLLSNSEPGVPEADRIAGEVYASSKALERAAYDATISKNDADRPGASELSGLLAERTRMIAGRASRVQAVNARAAEQAALLKRLRASIEMLESENRRSRTVLSEEESSLNDAKRELAIYEKGVKLGVASGVKYLDVQNYVHQREYAVLQTKTHLADLEQQLKAAKLDYDGAKMSFSADQAEMLAAVRADDAKIIGVPLAMSDTTRELHSKRASFNVALYHAKARLAKELTELDKLERKISESTAAIDLLEQMLAERVIRSPLDGVVSQCTHLAPGEMVERGQELMTVVPSDKQLLVRSHVKSTDIGFVKPGQFVRLRFDAFPCEEFGVVSGKVERIDNYPEPQEEQDRRVSTYRVDIVPGQDWIANGSNHIDLKIGMDVHADIVVRKRSILMLLLAPFFHIDS